MSPLVTTPGTGAILVGRDGRPGILLALDMSLPAVMAPLGRLVSRGMAALFRPAAGGRPPPTGTAGLPGRIGRSKGAKDTRSGRRAPPR